MKKEKDVSIYDLANELNVSIATISRALKDDPVVSKNDHASSVIEPNLTTSHYSGYEK